MDMNTGFHLSVCEVRRLMEGLDPDSRGWVGRTQLAASLMDWRQLQQNHSELWLKLAEKWVVFRGEERERSRLSYERCVGFCQ